MFYTALVGIKRHQLVKLVEDMSVTLRVYLHRLLLEDAEVGWYRVGEGISITLCLITNVAPAAETKRKAEASGEDYANAIEDDRECGRQERYTSDGEDRIVLQRIWGTTTL